MGAIPMAARGIQEDGPLGGGAIGALMNGSLFGGEDMGGSMGAMNILGGNRASPKRSTPYKPSDEDEKFLYDLLQNDPTPIISLLKQNPHILRQLKTSTGASIGTGQNNQYY